MKLRRLMMLRTGNSQCIQQHTSARFQQCPTHTHMIGIYTRKHVVVLCKPSFRAGLVFTGPKYHRVCGFS